jgi:CHAD domain-containing protein
MNGHRLDPSYTLFGAESLLKQLDALAKEVPGVREAKDIEHVHRMRVASRRLRVRLNLMSDCFPPKNSQEWTRQVRRLTRALGQARDTDVQIALVAGLVKDLKRDPRGPGLSRLLLRLSQRRGQLQKRVDKALDRLYDSGAPAEMEKELRRLRIGMRLHPGAEDPSIEALTRARDAVLPRLAEMMGFEIYVKDPARVAELHQMRIAAKRFRYAMEVFAAWYPGALKNELKAVRAIQEMLGDIHDSDVWLEFLPRFPEEERERALAFQGNRRGQARLKPGIAFLIEDRQAFREKRYREFIQFWDQHQQAGTWAELVKTLEEPLPKEEAPAPVPATGSAQESAS